MENAPIIYTSDIKCIILPDISVETNNNPTPTAAVVVYNSFKISELARIYNIPPPDVTKSNCVAIISFGGSLNKIPLGTTTPLVLNEQAYWTQTDVYNTWNAIDAIPDASMAKVIVYPLNDLSLNYLINVNTNMLDTSSQENTLDVAVIGAACPNPNLTIILFVCNNTINATANCIDAIINGVTVNGTNYNPSIISMSWGTSEKKNLARYTIYAAACDRAKAAGINMCVSTGDDGSSGILDPGSDPIGMDVNMFTSPSSVIAVGGTTIVSPNKIYDASTSEIVWDRTGGGVSIRSSMPQWQIEYKNDVSNNDMSGNTWRNTPDIALNADPRTGYLVRAPDNSNISYGGTSASAPLFAAYLASINLSPSIFIGPYLYKVASTANPNPSFHDIIVGENNINTSGNTTDFIATGGYDCASGLGSIHGANLLTAITAMLTTTTTTVAPVITTTTVAPVITTTTAAPVITTTTVAPVISTTTVAPVITTTTVAPVITTTTAAPVITTTTAAPVITTTTAAPVITTTTTTRAPTTTTKPPLTNTTQITIPPPQNGTYDVTSNLNNFSLPPETTPAHTANNQILIVNSLITSFNNTNGGYAANKVKIEKASLPLLSGEQALFQNKSHVVIINAGTSAAGVNAANKTTNVVSLSQFTTNEGFFVHLDTLNDSITFGSTGTSTLKVTLTNNNNGGTNNGTGIGTYGTNRYIYTEYIGTTIVKTSTLKDGDTYKYGGFNFIAGGVMGAQADVTPTEAANLIPYQPPWFYQMRSLFTNNAQVYYKPHSLASGGVGGVRNNRYKGRRT